MSNPQMTPIQRTVLAKLYEAPQKGHTAKDAGAKLNTLEALKARELIVELNPNPNAELLTESRRFRVTGAPVRVNREQLV